MIINSQMLEIKMNTLFPRMGLFQIFGSRFTEQTLKSISKTRILTALREPSDKDGGDRDGHGFGKVLLVRVFRVHLKSDVPEVEKLGESIYWNAFAVACDPDSMST